MTFVAVGMIGSSLIGAASQGSTNAANVQEAEKKQSMAGKNE